MVTHNRKRNCRSNAEAATSGKRNSTSRFDEQFGSKIHCTKNCVGSGFMSNNEEAILNRNVPSEVSSHGKLHIAKMNGCSSVLRNLVHVGDIGSMNLSEFFIV